MSEIPSDLKYTSTHEWVREEDDGTLTVGITDHAQHLLGDLVFIELPQLNSEYRVGSECCVVESVKAASDVYAPVSGEVIAINDALTDRPELANSDPYGEGWLFQINPADPAELDELMDADSYEEQFADSED
ncbi:MAG: glycine cleavage system protein [Gammaproteobacteria bacterium]|jgi:glycine cleavage system H protein|nr:glycine cleavage system protein [Gammaproteobacteria bacterium]